jgi:hypothetical protein
MDTSTKDPEAVPSEDATKEVVRPWRQTTFVVWRGKLQSDLCLSARQLPTVAPLVAWRVWEPDGRQAPLVPRRRRRAS